MRRRFVMCEGEMVEVTPTTTENVAPLVMPDIGEYTSMIDGSRITSRSQHRAHLKAHGCIELGNEKIEATYRGIPDADPGHRKELIVSQIQALGHEGFKRALRKDVEFVKWNSNGLPRVKE